MHFAAQVEMGSYRHCTVSVNGEQIVEFDTDAPLVGFQYSSESGVTLNFPPAKPPMWEFVWDGKT